MRRVGTLVIALGLAFTACSGGDDADQAIADMTPATSTAAPTTPAPPATTTPSTTTPATPTTAASTPATTAPVTVAPPTTAPPVERDFSAIDPIVADYVAERGLAGAGFVVVDRGDGIVYEGYWGEFDADRVSLVASSSKMITAGVLMKLHEDGLLDIDAPVADAVEWGVGNPDITIVQLVSNSSGLVGLGPDPAYGPYVCQFLPDRELEECAAAAFTTPDDDADVIPPDTEYRYGGVQWQVAGAVAEAVSGKSWADLIEEIYVRPCGVESLGYTNHWFAAGGFTYPADFDVDALEPTENPHMEAGAYLDAPDYAQLLLMNLRGGECPDGPVMSAESIARMHEDRVLTAYGDAGPDNPGYGMGWWVDRETGRIRDPGAYGSTPWLDLDAGYGAYLVVEADGSTGAELAGRLEPIVHEIMTG